MLTPIDARRAASACALVLLTASGCGELAYKRGAGAGELESDRRACRNAGATAAAFEQCMSARGWFVHAPGRETLLDADPVADVSVVTGTQRIENAVPPSPSNAAAATRRAPDPFDRFSISSWWKAGSSAATLTHDSDACVSELGEAHRPDPAMQRATRGLLLCMRGKGWSALRAK